MKPYPWLLLILTLPTQKSALRMRLWRFLNSLGCALLRDGVYLAPAAFVERQALEGLVEEVMQSAGSGYLLQVQSGGEESRLRGLFDRSSDYAAFAEQVQRFYQGLDAEGEAGKALVQLRKQLAEIERIDFFAGHGQQQAKGLLAEAEKRFLQRYQPGEPHTLAAEIFPRQRQEYQGRIWVTRHHLWVDRLASGWLIGRFIDERPTFLFLADPALAPVEGVGFDFDGAEFSHVADHVTFQTLLVAFGLNGDAALHRLGLLVRQMDVGVGTMAEESGVLAVLQGGKKRGLADDALLALSCELFDNLYAAFAAN